MIIICKFYVLVLPPPPPPKKKKNILNKKHINFVSISHLHKEPEMLSLLKKATLHNNNKYIKKRKKKER